MELMVEEYKQTEVGLIASDWQIGKLNDYWVVIDCKHVTAKFEVSGIPLASITEVQSQFVDLKNAMQTSDYFYYKLIEGGRKPLVGDLIFSRNATVGEVAQVAEWHPIFAMGQDVCLIRKRKSSYSTVFLQTLLESPIVRRQLENLMVGSTFKRVNIEQIRNFVIPFPGSDEQTAIATALSDADALIISLEKLIAKKRNIKQGAMQKLLEPKEGWEVKTYGEIFDFLSTASYSRAELTEIDKIGYVHYGDIHTKWNSFLNLDKSNLPTIPNNQLKGYHFLQEGDLIMADASEDYEGIGKSVEVVNLGSRRVISGLHTFLLRDRNEEFVNGFKGYIHSCKTVKSQLDRLATGLKVYGVSKANLKTVKIPIPPKILQVEITSTLFSMDAEINALEAKLEKYRNVKLGMMQNLLTGKIRLV